MTYQTSSRRPSHRFSAPANGRSARVVAEPRNVFASTQARISFAGFVFAAITLFFVSAQAREFGDSFADLAERLSPAVVNVATTQRIETSTQSDDGPRTRPSSPFEDLFRDFFDNPEGRPSHRGQPQARPVQSLGSGFIIHPSGIVVTNNHVIADADEVRITLANGRTLDAKIIGRDPRTDLAVLKVESDEPLPFVKWGNSGISRVGDWIMAIGNPFGLGGTVTAGIISARGRNINQQGYVDFLQTDASINRGNSGGPMFNMDGDVIGINTAIFSPTGGSVGIGFAIPSNLAKHTVDQLVEFGRTKRGWLGVRIQAVTDEIAEGLGLEKASGALVAEVTSGGPAEASGLQVGDVILTFDSREVVEMRHLPRIVTETKIGARVEVIVWRNEKRKRLFVEIAELEEPLQRASTTPTERVDQPVEILGMTIAPLTAELRERLSLGDETQGVAIIDVSGTGPAARRGIQPGDIIIEVGQEEVSTVAEVQSQIGALRQKGRASALFLIERNGDVRFVTIRFGDG